MFDHVGVFASVLLHCALWLVKKIAPLSQPIRSKTKTNRDLLASVFLRLALITCICFDFWLAHFVFCSVLLLVKARSHRRFLSRNSMRFLSRWSWNFNIASVNELRFQLFSAIYRAIACDLSPRFSKHGNFEQQFRYSAGAYVLLWFDLFHFVSFCFNLVWFCFNFVLFYKLGLIPKQKETWKV